MMATTRRRRCKLFVPHHSRLIVGQRFLPSHPLVAPFKAAACLSNFSSCRSTLVSTALDASEGKGEGQSQQYPSAGLWDLRILFWGPPSTSPAQLHE